MLTLNLVSLLSILYIWFKHNCNTIILQHGCSSSSTLRTYLLHVDFKRTKRLTFWTGAWLYFLVLWLEKGAKDEVTLVTVVFDHAELGQNSRTAGYHSAGADQLVQMKLPTNTKEIYMVLRNKAWRPFFYFLSNLFTEYHTFTNTFCPLIKKFCSMNIPIRWDLTQNTFAYSKSDFLPRFSPSYFITECGHRDTFDQSVHSKGFKPFRMTWSK